MHTDDQAATTRTGQLLRFAATGGVAFLVDVGLFNVLLAVRLPPVECKLLSVAMAVLVSFALTKNWTFAGSGGSRMAAQLTLFLASNAVATAISIGCLAASQDLLRLSGAIADNIAANGVGLALGSAFRFWSYQRYVFPSATGQASSQVTTDTARFAS